MVVEVYLVPGLNVVGILGGLLIVLAIGLAFSSAGLTGGVLALGGSIGGGVAVFYWMWKSGAWDRFVLSTSLQRDREADEDERDQRAQYLGKAGAAITPLRPTGIAEIGGDRIEVVTEGEYIAAGSLVRVVAMDRRKYFVRLAEALPEPQPQPTAKDAP